MSNPIPKSRKPLLLDWHLGLGDALICQGLVRSLVDEGHVITLPSWKHNLHSVQQVYQDLFDAGLVRILPVSDTGGIPDPILHGEILYLGYKGKDFDPERWDESFYHQAGVPFLDKWGRFEMEVSWDNLKLPGCYRFVHDDPLRGYTIPIAGADVIRPQYKSMIHHAYDLRCADEVHCINSCFAILADLLTVKGKLFIHLNARPDGAALPIFGQHWDIVD